MCGTNGLQAHGFGLGLVMGHDTKSVRCVWALESAFLRPRGPPTEVPATACFDACGRILGSLHRIFVDTRQCAATAQWPVRERDRVCVRERERERVCVCSYGVRMYCGSMKLWPVSRLPMGVCHMWTV